MNLKLGDTILDRHQRMWTIHQWVDRPEDFIKDMAGESRLSVGDTLNIPVLVGDKIKNISLRRIS